MDGQDGVARIVGVVEKGPEFGLLEGLFELGNGRFGVGFDALSFSGQFDEDLELLLLPEDPLEELNVLLEQLFLLLEGLGSLLVLPDLGGSQAGVYRFELRVLVVQVKENL
jgi:hypothetical protein